MNTRQYSQSGNRTIEEAVAGSGFVYAEHGGLLWES